MRNLAGTEDRTDEVAKELERVGIDIIDNPEPGRGEVPSKIIGRLVTLIGTFTFERGWRYWVVKGPCPLTVAQEIWDSPLKYEIRSGGFAGGIEPERVSTTYCSKTRKKLISEESYLELKEFIEKGFIRPELLEEYCTEAKQTYEVVGNFHVDTELGLYVLVQYLKEMQL